jgi:Fe-S cluster assembly iron-binding protein IscA
MKNVTFDVGANAVVQLGESLYKTPYGVLIEYITNSYDADASFVNISIDRVNKEVIIADDGTGMSRDNLEDFFLKVGDNRRKRNNLDAKTAKGRLVTGRKGFGKLACFGLFKEFKVETIQDKKKSILNIHTTVNESNEFEYTAEISDSSEKINEPNGTNIYLTGNTKEIAENEKLAESIAKRINLMYESSEDDPKGFRVTIDKSITINKSYRDTLILQTDIKFDYKIPSDLARFELDKESHDYIVNNNITGVVIAREKTVRIKENKGVVLFARSKLCQEATYLNINPSNNYGYAHLYSELDVSFIDNNANDNIGTDRTALKDTKTTEKLFDIIEALMKSYAKLYDADEKKRKDAQTEEIKSSPSYQSARNAVDKIKNKDIQDELKNILNMKVKESVQRNNAEVSNVLNFERVVESVISTHSIPTGQTNKDDVKDNIITSYDYLINHLREKYEYALEDGSALFNNIYGIKHSNKAKLTALINGLPSTTKNNARESLRELGQSIVKMRNGVQHTNDRECINVNISIENSKRFVIMVDLFIEIDGLCFESSPQISSQQS